MKKITMVLTLALGTMFLGSTSAQATDGQDLPITDKCYEQVIDQGAYDEEVVVKEAYDEEVIVTPAIPGKDAVEEVSHIVHHPAVTETVHHKAEKHKEYHFAKFTHTKTKTYTQGTPAVKGKWWVWTPNNTHGPQDYTPNFPSDNRGTWQGPKTNGGPDGEGTFQSGGGNSPWFHREAGTPAVPGGWSDWSAYGPWTKWSPEAHPSWELSSDPIGSPQFHGEGSDNGTKWHREWQARWDGKTRVIVDKPAYDEEVVVTEAYDEKVIDVEAEPAVPGVPAVTEIVHHDAVTETVHHEATYKNVEVPCDVCPDVEGDQPEGTDCNPVVPPVDEPPVTTTQALPDTGAGDVIGKGIIALVLIGAGVFLYRRMRD